MLCLQPHKIDYNTCYALKNEADEDEKDTFYNMLQGVTKDVPSCNIMYVVDDLNVKVGAGHRYCAQVLGCHSIGEMNGNGVLLVDYAVSNDLVIGETLLKHKTIHKYTWMSPDGPTRNQIEHFLISKHWRSSLLNVHGFPGVHMNSDHILVVAEIQIKLKAQKQSAKKVSKQVEGSGYTKKFLHIPAKQI